MSETPALRLPPPGPIAAPGDMPTGARAQGAPLLTLPDPARRAATVTPRAGAGSPRARLDVSAVYAARPQPGPDPLPFAPRRVSFVVPPPAAPRLGTSGRGPVLTVSIVDKPGAGPELVLAPASARWPVVASAASVVLVLVAAGVAAGAAAQWIPADQVTGAPAPSAHPAATTARPTPVRTATARPSATPARPSTSAPATASPSPDRPAVPDLALAMTAPAVLEELELQSREGAPAVAGLAGSWVPQVSFKCPGLQVDLGPGWVPDGTDDTAHVTVQQILALHLGLRQRFGALTVHPTQLGMLADRGSSGPCARQTIWMSVVPQGFASAQAAKNWCDVNALPVRECSARYVARPGERSTQVDRT